MTKGTTTEYHEEAVTFILFWHKSSMKWHYVVNFYSASVMCSLKQMSHHLDQTKLTKSHQKDFGWLFSHMLLFNLLIATIWMALSVSFVLKSHRILYLFIGKNKEYIFHIEIIHQQLLDIDTRLSLLLSEFRLTYRQQLTKLLK